MSNWKKVGPLSEFNKGNKWQVHIGGRPVALFKFEDTFYALKSACLHQGFPLADGNVKSYMVECPLHGWVYDMRNGKCLSLGDRFTKTYELRIKGKYLEIDMEGKENP